MYVLSARVSPKNRLRHDSACLLYDLRWRLSSLRPFFFRVVRHEMQKTIVLIYFNYRGFNPILIMPPSSVQTYYLCSKSYFANLYIIIWQLASFDNGDARILLHLPVLLLVIWVTIWTFQKSTSWKTKYNWVVKVFLQAY